MDEYINKEEILKKAKELSNTYSSSGLANVRIISAIEEAPIEEDVIKVVRCKDCKCCQKFYSEKRINEEARLVYYCDFFKSDRRPTDFCSFGERKTD